MARIESIEEDEKIVQVHFAPTLFRIVGFDQDFLDQFLDVKGRVWQDVVERAVRLVVIVENFQDWLRAKARTQRLVLTIEDDLDHAIPFLQSK